MNSPYYRDQRRAERQHSVAIDEQYPIRYVNYDPIENNPVRVDP